MPLTFQPIAPTDVGRGPRRGTAGFIPGATLIGGSSLVVNLGAPFTTSVISCAGWNHFTLYGNDTTAASTINANFQHLDPLDTSQLVGLAVTLVTFNGGGGLTAVGFGRTGTALNSDVFAFFTITFVAFTNNATLTNVRLFADVR